MRILPPVMVLGLLLASIVVSGVLSEQSLKGVRVERRRTRFLSGERAVTRVECNLGERRYSLAVQGAEVLPLRATAVRGSGRPGSEGYPPVRLRPVPVRFPPRRRL